MVFVIELFGSVIKGLVLAIRLFANMFAGHMVLAMILTFILVVGNAGYSHLWPVVTTASVLGVVALSLPLLLAIALAIRLDSPGPVLFSQERIGRFGRVFKILKFRSMRSAMCPVPPPGERSPSPHAMPLPHTRSASITRPVTRTLPVIGLFQATATPVVGEGCTARLRSGSRIVLKPTGWAEV